MKYIHTLALGLTLASAVILSPQLAPETSALDTGLYRQSSCLATGKWARVAVSQSGMQLITTQQLRALGFTDLSRVRVHGYGGREIPLELNSSYVDDLPEQPSVQTSKGIVFFGVDNVTWKAGQSGNNMYYERTVNPYSEESYYFITESDEPRLVPEAASAGTPGSTVKTSFFDVLLHEKNLAFAGETGRCMYGEDFRAQTSQTFPFTLTGASGVTKVRVVFGSKISGVAGKVGVSLNGEEQPNAITLTPTTDYANVARGTFNYTADGEKLNVGLRYTSQGGVLSMARLDYIQVEYVRPLHLNGGELYFRDPNAGRVSYTLSGCSADTQVWDVTNPAYPALVTGSLEGDKLTFVSPGTGYREYVAFNPAQVSRPVKPAGRVQNQDLHAMEVPDMVIITPSAWKSEAERLAQFRREHDAMVVHVFTPEEVYNEFSSGSADIGAFRKALKMWYDRGRLGGSRQLKYCILMSRATFDNLGKTEQVRRAGYPRLPMWEDTGGLSEHSSYGTDDIIAMLEDNPGRLYMDSEPLSIGVARMPVKSVTEAAQAVDKIIKYETEPQYGAWRNTILLFAEDKDGGTHLNSSEKELKQFRRTETGRSFIYKRIYLDSYDRVGTSSGFQFPGAKSDLLQALSEGVMLHNYVGHASPTAMTKSRVWTWEDMNSMTNRKLPFLFSATCELTRIDANDVSGGELMWLNPTSGYVGMYTTLRSVYMSNNDSLGYHVARIFMQRGADGKGLRLGDWFRLSKNAYANDNNKLRYLLVGDPALRINLPEHRIVIDRIGEHDMTGDAPTLGATERTTVTGHIEDFDGNPVPDFNGYIELTLFDAETVITTHGYGDSPSDKPQVYNDRVSKLFNGLEMVKDGRWTATLMVPPVIDNNSSPALLNAYAYSDKGEQASGYTENLQILGEGPEYGKNTDDKGPEITAMYLNSEQFADGDVVNSSPTLFASFTDESGLNIFGGTIGQQLTLKVDDDTFTNVDEYYSPKAGDPCSGSIQYPLSGIEPGEHTMTLTVWDLNNNVSEQTLTFNVAVGRAPNIYDITTDVNPASTSVRFTVMHDRPAEPLQCTVDVFDLGGKKVWSGDASTAGTFDSSLSVQWNLLSTAGARVPRGIYLYRATVTAQDGTVATKTRKLAVTAP